MINITNKPRLIVLVGLPGSGKSSIAKEIAEREENTIIVSSDAIREELTGKVEDQSKNEEVFKIFHKRIREGLENKYNVIADATNITMKSRRAILENSKNLDVIKNCILVVKSVKQCKIDNLHRSHPVPEEVISKMLRRFQIPFNEEGFNDIAIHYTKRAEGRLSMGLMLKQMCGYSQDNPHHTMDLREHCNYTTDLFSKYGYGPKYNTAAMLHDYGKLFCKTVDEDGVAHYYTHGPIGSYLVLENFSWYFTNVFVLDICFLINYHMLPFAWNSEKTKEEWKKRFGEYKYQMLMDFHECDKAR